MQNLTKLYASILAAVLLFIGSPLNLQAETALSNGIGGQPYTAQLKATGTQSCLWTVKSGSLPAGLNLGSSTGKISGVPQKAGSSTFTVSASATSKLAVAAVAPNTSSYSIKIVAPLVITTASMPNGQAGTAYSIPLQATGGVGPYGWEVRSGSLPAGVVMTYAGVVTGTPQQGGTFNFVAQATDQGSPAQTAIKAFTITVASGLKITSSSSIPSSIVGQAYSTTFAATGGTPAYKWSVSAGSLPAGLTLSSAGTLSGKPTTAGTSTFTILVKDSSRPVESQTAALSLTVASPLAITTSQVGSATSGTAYTSTLSATGGTPPYQWSIAGGTFPPGLGLNPSTGTISGTPTAAGSYGFTASVRDSGSPDQQQQVNLSITVAAVNGPTTWYVRPDGGTRYSVNATAGQCDGKADAPYSGSGVNQHCAFNDYRFLWDDQHSYGVTKWVIAGGDTVILEPNLVNGVDQGWRVGFNQGANSNDPWCWGGQGPYACTNPTIPSGKPNQHTRILGKNWASCSTGNTSNRSQMTQIFGGFGVYTPLNIAGAQYLDIQCLEITRHSQCTLGGLNNSGNPYPGPCSKSNPVDDYDSDGIEEDNTTSNVYMQDLWIHGHPGRGVKGPIGGPIFATRLDIAYNAAAGWDFDDGSSTPFGAGAEWHFNDSTIEWSGCYQQYPAVDPYPAISCYDQNHQGYGDGVGTAPGQWLSVYIDHSNFLYNVQDGEDFGHVDGGGGTFSVTNSVSYANGGGQFKWGWGFNNILFENNLVDANCARLAYPIAGEPAAFQTPMQPSDLCRAGDALSFNFNNATNALFAHNTIVTYAPVTFDYKCVPINGQSNCDQTVFTLTDNIVRAYANPDYSYNGDGAPGAFCGASCNGSNGNGNDGGRIGTINRSNNTYFGIRGSCIANQGAPDAVSSTSTNETCADPLFVNEPHIGSIALSESDTDLDHFNFALSPASPAMLLGVTVPGGLSTDFNGSNWPVPPSLGAVQFFPNLTSIVGPPQP